MNDDRRKSLRLAVELEEEGQRYYAQEAAKADNPLAKTVLQTLADQEMDHRDRVMKLAEGHGFPEEFRDEERDIEESVREVFESFSAEEREGWSTENTGVYEHAMELERKSYKLYERLAEESQDEKEQSFFESLMKEESRHLESIENVYYFLASPGTWLSVDESQRWNWMNI
ncbi:MAG: ferritin-like domain-containing protein [Bacillota bacterium]